MKPAERDPIYDEANGRVRVEDLAATKVKLARVGPRLRGQCPVCQAGKGKLKDGPFWIDPRIGRWGCFAEGPECAPGGDAVRLEQLIGGGTAREAAERIVGPLWTAPPTAKIEGRAPAGRQAEPIEPSAEEAKKAQMAARWWAEARSCHGGDLVAAYLGGRGIAGAVREAMLPALRFHPSVFWGVVEEPERLPKGAQTVRLSSGEVGLLLPAMLAAPRTPEGRTGGVHATYLRRDGTAKARLNPAKIMWGPQKGFGRPGGAMLAPEGDGPLIVGEGIETVASAATLHHHRTGIVPRMAAALSLRALSGGWLADDRGRYDPDAPSADPERPAFTWPDVGEAVIAVDRDMKPVQVTVRGPGGRKTRRWLSSDDRARISGSLAEQNWRAAGANPVRTIAPPAGMDFNDHLRSLGL